MKKTTVYNILDVFKTETESPEEREEFNMKKKIVSDAIDAVYSHKNDEYQKKPIFQDDVTFARRSQNMFVQEKPKTGNLKTPVFYKTPEKKKRANEHFESINTTSRSASMSKLNYSRTEKTFS